MIMKREKYVVFSMIRFFLLYRQIDMIGGYCFVDEVMREICPGFSFDH